MQIKNTPGYLDPYSKLEQTEKNKAARLSAERKNGEAATNSGDTQTLSAAGKLHAEAYSMALNSPDARAEKVARLKELVDNGEYTIDTKQIALNLLKEDTELLGL